MGFSRTAHTLLLSTLVSAMVVTASPEAYAAQSVEDLYSGTAPSAAKLVPGDEKQRAQWESLMNDAKAARSRRDLVKARQAFEAAAKLAFSMKNKDFFGGLTAMDLAYINLGEGKLPQAQKLFTDALYMRKKLNIPNDQVVSGAMAGIAYVDLKQNKLSEAESYYKQALLISEKAPAAVRDKLVAARLNGLGMVKLQQKKYAEAESLLKRAADLREKAVGKSHEWTITSLQGLSDSYKARSMWSQMASTEGRIVANLSSAQQKDDLRIARAMAAQADALTHLKKLNEAEKLYASAAATFQTKLGAANSETKAAKAGQAFARANAVAGMVSQASQYKAAKDYGKAEQTLKAAVAQAQSTGDQGAQIAALAELGDVYNRSGKFNESIVTYQNVIGLQEKKGNSPELVVSLVALSYANLSQKKFAPALAAAQRAASVGEQIKAPPKVVANAYENVAHAFNATGNATAAKANAEKSAALYTAAKSNADATRMKGLAAALQKQSQAELAYKAKVEQEKKAYLAKVAAEKKAWEAKVAAEKKAWEAKAAAEAKLAAAKAAAEKKAYEEKVARDKKAWEEKVKREQAAYLARKKEWEEKQKSEQARIKPRQDWYKLSLEGDAALRAKNFAKAEQSFTASLKLAQTAKLGAMYESSSLRALGNTALAAKKLPQAEALLKNSVTVRETMKLANDTELAAVVYDLGRVYQEEKKNAEAEGAYRRALSLVEKTPNVKSVDTAYANLSLAGVYAQRNAFAQAEQSYARAAAMFETRKDVANMGRALIEQSIMQRKQKNGAAAVSTSQKAVQAIESARADQSVLALAYSELGQAYAEAHEFTKASDAMNKAASVAQAAKSPDAARLKAGAAFFNAQISTETTAKWYDAMAAADKAVRAKDYAKGEQLYQNALKLAEQIRGGENNIADSARGLAYAMANKGDMAKAEEMYNKAISMKEKAKGSKDPGLVATLLEMGYIFKSKGKLSTAEVAYKKAIAAAASPTGPTKLSILPLSELGTIYAAMDKTSEAEKTLKQAIAAATATTGKDSLEAAAAMAALGRVQFGRKLYADAEKYLAQSAAIREQKLGRDNVETANTYIELGNARFEQRKFTEAEKAFLAAVPTLEKRYGPTSPQVTQALQTMAGSMAFTLNARKAVAIMERVYANKEKMYKNNNAELARAAADVGFISSTAHEYSTAEKYFLKAIKLLEGSKDPKQLIELARYEEGLAHSYREHNNPQAALPLYVSVLNIREKHIGPATRPARVTVNDLAYTYLELGNKAESSKWFDQLKLRGGLSRNEDR